MILFYPQMTIDILMSVSNHPRQVDSLLGPGFLCNCIHHHQLCPPYHSAMYISKHQHHQQRPRAWSGKIYQDIDRPTTVQSIRKCCISQPSKPPPQEPQCLYSINKGFMLIVADTPETPMISVHTDLSGKNSCNAFSRNFACPPQSGFDLWYGCLISRFS